MMVEHTSMVVSPSDAAARIAAGRLNRASF